MAPFTRWRIGEHVLRTYRQDYRAVSEYLKAGDLGALLADCRMAKDLFDAMKQLLPVLREHFRAHGRPPRPSYFSYPVDKDAMLRKERGQYLLDRRFEQAKRDDVRLMAALIGDKPHPLVAEALDNIPELEETAALLKAVSKALQGEAASAATTVHCRFLFDRLLAQPWFTGNPRAWSEPGKMVWGYYFRPIRSKEITGLRQAVRRALASQISNALSAKEQEALSIIRDEGPIAGPALAHRLKIKLPTLMSHYIPKLKKHGVVKAGQGKGYTIKKSPSRNVARSRRKPGKA